MTEKQKQSLRLSMTATATVRNRKAEQRRAANPKISPFYCLNCGHPMTVIDRMISSFCKRCLQ